MLLIRCRIRYDYGYGYGCDYGYGYDTVSRGDLVAVIVDDYVLSLADGPTFFLFRGSFFVDAPESSPI